MKYFKSGLKFDTREGAQRIWREKEVSRKLHFTQELKAKVVGFAINVFENNAKKQEVNPV